MGIKFRSRVNYASIHSGDKKGFNLGLDGAIFLREQSARETFAVPRIGTQGKSTSGATPSLDISAGTDNSIQINVDNTGNVTATIASLTGLDTGAEIAAALETAINDALIAAGKDARVWCEFAGGLYIVWSQSTGLTSSVVITNAAADNVADDLKLGLANTGAEVVGTDDQDFLLYTTGGPTFQQPIESNAHRSGRMHTGIIKKKKVAEFNFQTYINMSGSAAASIDTSVKLLWKALLGTEVVNAGVSLVYKPSIPNTYMSLVRVSTIFGEYYTGAYVREANLEGPGDGPATATWQGKAGTRSIAGIGKLDSAMVATATAQLEAGDADKYTVGARVMALDPDGQTIVAGADGALIVSTVDTSLDQLGLSASISVADTGYIVPWHPGAVQQTGRDAIFTDLVGSVKLRSAGSAIDVTQWSLNIVNDHVDRDNIFGKDANAGFVAGNRLTATLSLGFELSNENFGEVVQSENFAGFDPVVTLGVAGGRYMEIAATKWIPSVPPIEVPENGVTPITMEGVLYQTASGKNDPFEVRFK